MALGNPHIDYFSLDIEGAELVMLKTLPFDEISITLLDIETNHAGVIFPGSREDISEFLRGHNYKFDRLVTIDDFYYKPEINRF